MTSTVKLKFWLSPGACSLAPHILLCESGLEYETVVVDVTKGGLTEEHRRINPKMRIPILELGDGNIITETSAVMTAISQLAPEKHLLGATNLEVVRTYEWFNWLSGTVHERGLGALFSPQWFAADPAAQESVRETAKNWLTSCFKLIDEKLADRKTAWASGDNFTGSDAFLYVICRWGYLIGWEMNKLYPHYWSLVEKVIERKGVLEAVKKEGIPLLRDDRLTEKQAKEMNIKET